MSEEPTKEEKPTKSEQGGETVIEDEVVASIAVMAAQEVEGVAGLGKSTVRRALAQLVGGPTARVGVGVEVGKTEAVVDLTLTVTYGYNIPSVVDKVRSNVASQVSKYAGLTAKEINVHVSGVVMPHKKEKEVKKGS